MALFNKKVDEKHQHFVKIFCETKQLLELEATSSPEPPVHTSVSESPQATSTPEVQVAPTAGVRLFGTQEVSPGLGGGTFPAVPKSWAEDKIGEAAGSGDNAGASRDAGGHEKKALATTAEATTVDETDLLLGSPAKEDNDEKKDEEDNAS